MDFFDTTSPCFDAAAAERTGTSIGSENAGSEITRPLHFRAFDRNQSTAGFSAGHDLAGEGTTPALQKNQGRRRTGPSSGVLPGHHRHPPLSQIKRCASRSDNL
jgi:hypothetical protein